MYSRDKFTSSANSISLPFSFLDIKAPLVPRLSVLYLRFDAQASEEKRGAFKTRWRAKHVSALRGIVDEGFCLLRNKVIYKS